jgi:hypothetical protein
MLEAIAWTITILGGSHFIYRTLKERYSDMRSYLEPEAKKEGFIVVSSKPYKPSSSEYSFPIEDEDINASPAFAGIGAVMFRVRSIPQEVVLENKENKRYQVLASIDFVGDYSKKVKRVRWKPDLIKIKENE